MDITARLRPMNIGDMFDAAFRLYREHFLTFVGIVVLLEVPITLARFLSQRTMLWRASGWDWFVNGPLGLFPYQFSPAVWAIQYLIVQQLIAGALAHATSRAYLNQPVSVLGAYRLGVRRYAALLPASLAPFALDLILSVVFDYIFLLSLVLVNVLVAPGLYSEAPRYRDLLLSLGLLCLLCLLWLSVFWLYIRCFLATQVIVLEGCGPLAALRRNSRLARPFRRMLAAVLSARILGFFFSIFPPLLYFEIPRWGSRLDWFVVDALTPQVVLILALPLQIAIYTLLYYDLRVRNEGYDLELRMQQATAS